jgi:type II secretory pathway component GspD/PulD (secretin)
MKAKIIIMMFSGLLAGSVAVSAQNYTLAVTDAAATSTNAATTDTSAGVAAANSGAALTNAAAPAADAAAQSADATSTNAAIQAATDTSTVADATAAPIIPLIVMDDVPLTDAIKNLARQANINYMLDPKLSYGQMGPDGRPISQPTVSIRWENITAEQALTALINNYGLQLVPDPKTKIFRVTIKDPAVPDPLQSRIIQLKYASPSNLLAAVETTLIDKRSKVMADVRTSQLVVLATERELDAVDQLVARLDTQTRQVLIEARLLETVVSPSTEKGINWAGTLAAQHVTVGNNALPGIPAQTAIPANPTLGTAEVGASQGIIGGLLSNPQVIGSLAKGSFFSPATAFLNADGVNAVVSFLNQNSDTKVISEPRAVTLDNETAHLEVVRATPIINVTAGTANTTGGSQITYTNLGIILDVTPRISANSFINLKVVPEVSRYADTISKTIQGQLFQADEYDLRRIETRVMIPSGNTLVLGGLVSDDLTTQNNKVPLLGDIPVLGYAFRSDYKQRTKQNLLVFITPTIVQDSDFQDTPSNFLKTPVAVAKDKIPDWSFWDTGKPWDWSKSAD